MSFERKAYKKSKEFSMKKSNWNKLDLVEKLLRISVLIATLLKIVLGG